CRSCRSRDSVALRAEHAPRSDHEIDRSVVRQVGDRGHELLVEHERAHQSGEVGQGPVVVPGAAAEPVPDMIDRERGHDGDLAAAQALRMRLADRFWDAQRADLDPSGVPPDPRHGAIGAADRDEHLDPALDTPAQQGPGARLAGHRQVGGDPSGPDQGRQGCGVQRDRLGRARPLLRRTTRTRGEHRRAQLVLVRLHRGRHAASLGPMNALDEARAKMRAAGVAQQAIDVFSAFYHQLEDGASGLIRESDVEPLKDLARIDHLDYDEETLRRAASKTVVIKLNGGLGTTMGMDRAKSLLPVKHRLSFLDLIVDQVWHVRSRFGVDLPLLFMNSFRTRDETLEALARYPEL